MKMFRMRYTNVVLLTTLMATHADGQELPELARKSLGKLVAVWEIEVDADGEVFKDAIDAKWNQDQTAVVYHWRGKDRLTKKPVTSTGVIGWDGERNVLIEFGVASNGEIFSSSFDVSKEHWRCPTKGRLLIDGQYRQLKSLRIFKWRSADEFVIATEQRSVDGKTEPDTIATFRRAVGAPAGDLWKAYRKAATGKWVGEGKLLWDIPQYEMSKDDPFALQLSLHEETQGAVLAGNQDFQVKSDPLDFQARIVVGWDPDSRQVRLFAFWSDGFVEELFFSRMEGNTFFGTYTSKTPGMPTDRWPICLQFPNPDSYEYKFLGGPHKGKVLSSWKREKK